MGQPEEECGCGDNDPQGSIGLGRSRHNNTRGWWGTWVGFRAGRVSSRERRSPHLPSPPITSPSRLQHPPSPLQHPPEPLRIPSITSPAPSRHLSGSPPSPLLHPPAPLPIPSTSLPAPLQHLSLTPPAPRTDPSGPPSVSHSDSSSRRWRRAVDPAPAPEEAVEGGCQRIFLQAHLR